MNLKKMLIEMLDRKASDLHIRVGIRPHLRVNGHLEQIAVEPLTIDDVEAVVGQLLNEKQLDRFRRKAMPSRPREERVRVESAQPRRLNRAAFSLS